MTNTPKPRDAQFVMNVPAGTRIKEFNGRLIVAEPGDPPYFLVIELGSNGPKPIKTPLITG